jgi:hypothetical protein
VKYCASGGAMLWGPAPTWTGTWSSGGATPPKNPGPLSGRVALAVRTAPARAGHRIRRGCRTRPRGHRRLRRWPRRQGGRRGGRRLRLRSWCRPRRRTGRRDRGDLRRRRRPHGPRVGCEERGWLLGKHESGQRVLDRGLPRRRRMAVRARRRKSRMSRERARVVVLAVAADALLRGAPEHRRIAVMAREARGLRVCTRERPRMPDRRGVPRFGAVADAARSGLHARVHGVLRRLVLGQVARRALAGGPCGRIVRVRRTTQRGSDRERRSKRRGARTLAPESNAEDAVCELQNRSSRNDMPSRWQSGRSFAASPGGPQK